MDKTIYFVSVVEKCESDEYGWPDFGNRRFVGWFSDLIDAINAVENNNTDIWEYCYNLAFIEPYDEGFCGIYPSDEVLWFQFNQETNKYQRISQPLPVTKHFCGFTTATYGQE